MDDRDFFDVMYQQWAKTTGAENTYWMPVRHERKGKGPMGVFYIDSVGMDDEGQETRKRIASYLAEEDADFITAVHGCFGDLTRRLHMALDEADTADLKKDERECRIAELELEVDELKAKLGK